MKKNQKLLVVGGGGLLVLLLLYRWYQSKQKPATPGVDPQQQSAADFASLAGTEQSDVAALQGAEQRDVNDLQGSLSTQQAAISALPTQADLTNLENTQQQELSQVTGEISGLGTAVSSLGSTIAGIQVPPPVQNITQVIQGGKPPAKITTHKGGGFYNYYQKVTGHAPPANLPGGDTNIIYQQWKAGVKPPGRKAPPKPPKPGNPTGNTGTIRTPVDASYATHTTMHQAVNPGHTNGHAATAVAPSTHAPKAPPERKAPVQMSRPKPPPPPPKPKPVSQSGSRKNR